MSAACPQAQAPVDLAKVGWLADTDEMAAILEASGVNDRVAADRFGHATVFTLAKRMMRDRPPAPSTVEDPPARSLRDGLIRAMLYLTPAALSIGHAPLLAGLPWYATTGPMIAGWASGQALAYLGYCAVNEADVGVACRRLASGFALLFVGWLGVLTVLAADATSFLVCTVQCVLFAAITAALVSGRERITLAVSIGCWFGWLHPALTVLSLLAMLVVAYRPVLRAHGTRWLPGRDVWLSGLSYGVVGAGQALMFIVVVLRPGASFTSLSVVPLLLGIPVTEMVMIWHRRRVARGRARLTSRVEFAAYLRRLSHRMGLALIAPVLAVIVLSTWDGEVAASCALVAVNGACLLLVEHRSRRIAMALVWLPLPLLHLVLFLPGDTGLLLAAVLVGSFLIVLPQAVLVIRDPRSYP